MGCIHVVCGGPPNTWNLQEPYRFHLWTMSLLLRFGLAWFQVRCNVCIAFQISKTSWRVFLFGVSKTWCGVCLMYASPFLYSMVFFGWGKLFWLQMFSLSKSHVGVTVSKKFVNIPLRAFIAPNSWLCRCMFRFQIRYFHLFGPSGM